MSTLDWCIAGGLVISILLAAAQGLIFELFSLAGVVVGYLLAVWGYQTVAAWYLPMVKAPWAADIAGFLTIFLSVVVLAGVIGRILRWAAKEAGLRWFDRVLGGAFGLVRGALVITIILLGMAAFVPRSTLLEESRIAPHMLVVGRAIVWVAPDGVRRRFDDGMDKLRELRTAKERKAAAK